MSMAYIGIVFAQAMFRKKSGEAFTLADFTLWNNKEEPDEYGTVEDVFELLSSIAKGK